MGFIGNLLLFLAVKEFWKSVKNWQSYRDEFVVLLFGTVCICSYCCGCYYSCCYCYYYY